MCSILCGIHAQTHSNTIKMKIFAAQHAMRTFTSTNSYDIIVCAQKHAQPKNKRTLHARQVLGMYEAVLFVRHKSAYLFGGKVLVVRYSVENYRSIVKLFYMHFTSSSYF